MMFFNEVILLWNHKYNVILYTIFCLFCNATNIVFLIVFFCLKVLNRTICTTRIMYLTHDALYWWNWWKYLSKQQHNCLWYELIVFFIYKQLKLWSTCMYIYIIYIVSSTLYIFYICSYYTYIYLLICSILSDNIDTHYDPTACWIVID